MSMGEHVIKRTKSDGIMMAFTEDSGLMQKVHLMNLFSTPLSKCEEQNFPRLLIFMATTTANHDVGSSDCHRVYQIGFPTNMYNLVPGMGHCDRDRLLAV